MTERVLFAHPEVVAARIAPRRALSGAKKTTKILSLCGSRLDLSNWLTVQKYRIQIDSFEPSIWAMPRMSQILTELANLQCDLLFH